MKRLIKSIKIVLGIFLAILIFIPAYALPATYSLGWGPRPGLEPLTIKQAVDELHKTGMTGWSLVEAARALVADRMQYSRRNAFDSSGRAFERGYGYCTQHAYALANLLTKLGFEAKVVHAFHNRFPDGKVGSHAWVSVSMDQETRHIDSLFYDAQAGENTFIPLSEVLEISPTFKLLNWWGGTAVNAHRYYITGQDM
jgi:hypothetical protein